MTSSGDNAANQLTGAKSETENLLVGALTLIREAVNQPGDNRDMIKGVLSKVGTILDSIDSTSVVKLQHLDGEEHCIEKTPSRVNLALESAKTLLEKVMIEREGGNNELGPEAISEDTQEESYKSYTNQALTCSGTIETAELIRTKSGYTDDTKKMALAFEQFYISDDPIVDEEYHRSVIMENNADNRSGQQQIMNPNSPRQQLPSKYNYPNSNEEMWGWLDDGSLVDTSQVMSSFDPADFSSPKVNPVHLPEGICLPTHKTRALSWGSSSLSVSKSHSDNGDKGHRKHHSHGHGNMRGHRPRVSQAMGANPREQMASSSGVGAGGMGAEGYSFHDQQILDYHNYRPVLSPKSFSQIHSGEAREDRDRDRLQSKEMSRKLNNGNLNQISPLQDSRIIQRSKSSSAMARNQCVAAFPESMRRGNERRLSIQQSSSSCLYNVPADRQQARKRGSPNCPVLTRPFDSGNTGSSGGSESPVPPLVACLEHRGSGSIVSDLGKSEQSSAYSSAMSTVTEGVPMTAQGGNWNCKICTLVNKPLFLACEACGSERSPEGKKCSEHNVMTFF